jgi:hypothetical protein
MSKVSEPCSAKLRACVDHLIAQGKPESSAWAICKAQLNEKLREAKTANVCGTCNWVQEDPKQPIETCPLCGAKAYYVPVLHPNESFKHPDFQKIQNQFIQQCGEQEGLQRYQEWVNRLGLDESKSYLANATMREKFQWVRKHVDFELWKEDVDAKYWKVEVAFPLESMNSNVYSREELQLAARTLKGKPVNLNHKFNFPTVEIVASEFESDTVEAILRIPRALKCPICDKNKTLNELIETNGIVNVSHESGCEYGTGSHGECQGMSYTGLALLTKDVLAGIPLTRLMPLESIMVEALQTDETKTRKTKKLELKIVEKPKSNQESDATNPILTPTAGECPTGYHKNEDTGECVKDIEQSDTSAQTVKGTSVEDALIDEKVGRIKAEREATKGIQEFKDKATEWEKQFRDSEAKLIKQTGMIEAQTKTIERLEKQVADRDLKAVEDGRKLSDREDRLKDAILSRDDYKLQLEKVKTEHETLTGKYHDGLKTNLDLSRKLTAANEDYLTVSKESDDTKEALKRAQIQAKKIIRITP